MMFTEMSDLMKYKGRAWGLFIFTCLAIGWSMYDSFLYGYVEWKFKIMGIILMGLIAWRLGLEYDKARGSVDKLHRRKLQRSDERFQKIFKNAGIGIALLDKEGRLFITNPKLQEMKGKLMLIN